MPCNSDVDDQFNVNTDVTFGYKFSLETQLSLCHKYNIYFFFISK